MILIKQKNSSDCGQAVLAMLGVESSQYPSDRPLTTEDMMRAMPESYLFPLFLPLNRISTLPSPSAVLIWPPDAEYGHWVAINSGVLYDPLCTEPMMVDEVLEDDFAIIALSVAS